jgi:tetratricopeptide (TPR) repeat protein
MKKNILYTTLVFLFAAAITFVIIKFKKEAAVKENIQYTLLDRNGVLAEMPEWQTTKATAARLQGTVNKNPKDIKAQISLAGLFITEARATGNYAYYDKAAMKYISNILKNDPQNFEALTLKSLLYLSQHHFADGLATAETAKNINPYNAFVYGILVDGNVEMGNYDSAVANAQKMMSIRPDLRSYARAAYLREIYGDYPGAAEAMKLAVEAGAPGDEGTEWCRVQLGHLYENSGDFKNAAINYTIALENRKNYAYALAGMARIAVVNKDYEKAIALYQQADTMVNDFLFKEELVDVFTLTGQNEKAAATSKIIIDELTKNATAAATDENIGHYADRELAYAYLKINNADKALEHALAEYNRRPKNIDANETLAWVYYQKGDYGKAIPYIKEALKTNSKNPLLLCRAGLIFEKTGDKAKAKEYLEQASKNNAVLPEQLKQSSELALKEI